MGQGRCLKRCGSETFHIFFEEEDDTERHVVITKYSAKCTECGRTRNTWFEETEYDPNEDF